MRMIIIILAVIALMVVATTPAIAAIHPNSQGECAVDGTPGNDQNPSGQIDNPSTAPGAPHDGLAQPFRNSNANGASGQGNTKCTNN